MMRTILLTLGLALLSFTVFAQTQTNDPKLEQRLQQLVKGFNGDVGIYVKNLKTGRSAGISADSIFPTASMVKLAITAGVFNQIDKGQLDYKSVLTYKDSLLYAGEDILGSFKNGEQIALSKVLMLMITTSDNTASLWAQSLAGTGTAINDLMAQYGLTYTRVNSRTPGRQENQKKYGWGQTTPKEMATLLTLIRNGKLINEAASERIYRNLIRIYFDQEALSQIPPYIQAASKSGAVDEARSEVVLVNAPHGDYVFCITTKNQKDTSWTPSNEGWVLIRKLSRMLWHYYEPASSWVPAAGMDKYNLN
ncbi:serine hydrolase [Pedobacter sp. HMWF019]|uniref:serine hydrolase n=1 Tax=Pedobacter sp. HMWF019 TaxID=2056856 RepID=UPI001E500581|nr:serine hydrolase [Pedobacter sp. HMWF019]